MNTNSPPITVPVGHWVTRQAVVFDWYDGPREGVVALGIPGGEFVFELLDERPTEDDLDDRLFRLSELPAGSLHRILTALQDLGDAAVPVWAPVWRFSGEEARQAAEREIQAVLKLKRPTPLIVATRDMESFQGCWTSDAASVNGANWFTARNIAGKLG